MAKKLTKLYTFTKDRHFSAVPFFDVVKGISGCTTLTLYKYTTALFKNPQITTFFLYELFHLTFIYFCDIISFFIRFGSKVRLKRQKDNLRCQLHAFHSYVVFLKMSDFLNDKTAFLYEVDELFKENLKS